MRVFYDFDRLSGTLDGTPSVLGPFSQQTAIQSNLRISASNIGFLSVKGPDSLMVSLPSLSIAGSVFLDQTEPLPFSDAHWSVSFLKPDGTLQPLFSRWLDQLGSSGPNDPLFTGALSGEAGLQGTAEIPLSWINQGSPLFANWQGQGQVNLTLDFIISLEGYVGPLPEPVGTPAPVPGSLLLFGSGLLGWAGYRLKFRKS
ncbi:MAG: PEP-CTERM sorting domain-containing protein [Thermodesulfobacteriota bacterium]